MDLNGRKCVMEEKTGRLCICSVGLSVEAARSLCIYISLYDPEIQRQLSLDY